MESEKFQFLQRFFIFNASIYTGMFMGYAIGKNIDDFYFIPIVIIWVAYMMFYCKFSSFPKKLGGD